MKVSVDSKEFRSACRAVVALSTFDKKAQDKNKQEEHPNPCLITAKGKKLLIEAADSGIFISYHIPAEVKEEGVFGASAAVLSRCRGTGTITLASTKKTNTIAVKAKGLKYEIAGMANVEEQIDPNRPKKARIKKSSYFATLSTDVFKTLVSTVSFTPGLKEEGLRIQIKCTKKMKKGAIEIVGLDSYSFARMEVSGKDIKVSKSAEAVVKTHLLNNIMKELGKEDDEVAGNISLGIIKGPDGKPALMRVTSESFDLFHPVLVVPLIDVAKIVKKFTKGKKPTSSFEIGRQNLLDSVANATALMSNSDGVKLKVAVNKKSVVFYTDAKGNKSKSKADTESITVGKSGDEYFVHATYLANFIHLAPEVVPLTVESCGNVYVKVKAENLESSSIEFLVSKATQEAQD